MAKETPRFPDLKEAVDELIKIFPDDETNIMFWYNKYKNEPVKAVTVIWSEIYKISKLINFALIVDAGAGFSFDKDEMKQFEDYIGMDYQLLIK